MNIIIDIGNTLVKVAVFEQDEIIDLEKFNINDIEKRLSSLLNKFPKYEIIVISNVGKLEKNTQNFLKNIKSVIAIDRNSSFPFVNLYETPDTLGMDRIVLASGAVLKYPNKNCLLIDAGTCITYDFVDSSKNYLGGAIAPGVAMRYKALHQFTANLPYLEKKNPEKLIGTTTEECIHSGVVNGTILEIEGTISHYLDKYKDLTIILTGGDAYFLANRLKSTIFAHSNFLLESLNRLYYFNNKE